MRRAIRFWGPVFGKEASLDALRFSLLGAWFWQGGEIGCVWSGASVLASWGCSGFSRRVCSLINCKFAGVLPEAFYLGFADEIFARALERRVDAR